MLCSFCLCVLVSSLTYISHSVCVGDSYLQACSFSGRNKSQKLVGHFFEDRTICRLLIAIPLEMYIKIG